MPDEAGNNLDLTFKSHFFSPLLVSKEIFLSVDIIILFFETTIGFARKIISVSGLKFCIQLISFEFIRLRDYKVPLVERNNRLFFSSKARLLLKLDTVFEG